MWISNFKQNKTKKKIIFLTVLKVKRLSFKVKNQEQEFYFAEAFSCHGQNLCAFGFWFPEQMLCLALMGVPTHPTHPILRIIGNRWHFAPWGIIKGVFSSFLLFLESFSVPPDVTATTSTPSARPAAIDLPPSGIVKGMHKGSNRSSLMDTADGTKPWGPPGAAAEFRET